MLILDVDGNPSVGVGQQYHLSRLQSQPQGSVWRDFAKKLGRPSTALQEPHRRNRSALKTLKTLLKNVSCAVQQEPLAPMSSGALDEMAAIFDGILEGGSGAFPDLEFLPEAT